MFFQNKAGSLEESLTKNTLILKRSPVYLYKNLFYMCCIIVLYIIILYINFFSKDRNIPIYLYIILMLSGLWFLFLIQYGYTLKKSFKTYFLLGDKKRLLQRRIAFTKFLNISLSILGVIIILIVINLFFITSNLLEFGTEQNDILQLGVLLISFFANILIIFLEYIIIKRFFKLEMDIIIFNREGIRYIYHNSFFGIYTHFTKVNDITNISVISKGIMNTIFDVGSIKITGVKVIHYDYIKDPEKIYDIILQLIKSQKN